MTLALTSGASTQSQIDLWEANLPYGDKELYVTLPALMKVLIDCGVITGIVAADVDSAVSFDELPDQGEGTQVSGTNPPPT